MVERPDPQGVPAGLRPGEPEALHLLLVEDDEVDRMAFERFVRTHGLPYTYSVAGSLGEARSLLVEEDFDVVLTDVHLGDGDGLEILALGLGIPVIVITGAGREAVAVEAMRAGAYDYLSKDTERRYLELLQVTVEKARRVSISARQERLLTEALRSINDAVFITDPEGRLSYVNDTFRRAYGFADGEILGQPSSNLWAEEADHELLPAPPELLPREGESGECWHRRRDGSVFAALLSRAPIDDAHGRRVASVGAVHDITDRKRAEEQLMHAALHDALTGLPNRILFMDRLENALARARRKEESGGFGVVFLDLDRFKTLNDSLGHQAGDCLLQAIAERLSGCLRGGDTVARLGGDEFAILVDELEDVRGVHDVARRIHRSLEAPFEIEGHECFTSASLGIALSTHGYERAEDVLRDADIAMYRAKSAGRTRHVVFRPDMHLQAMAALHLENDLRRAVEREEFRLRYQPLVDLASGGLLGFEALVRWQHPERGLLTPGDFLPAAQETGLSAAIGWWVLGAACRQLRLWRDRSPALRNLSIHVNLDASQLSSVELPERIDTVLEETGVGAEGLCLEITEDMIIEDPKRVARVLGILRETGIRLHVDDFGTGYSSLGQLRRLPVDALKIDRSFVSRMTARSGDLEIVRTIVQLGRNLGLEVVAEGIERPDQLSRLRQLGCGHGQGFLFGQPKSAPEVDDWLHPGVPVFSGFEDADGGGGGDSGSEAHR
ncbi:MAG: EAL domain-containing protein [Acidobacteriota bacterium]